MRNMTFLVLAALCVAVLLRPAAPAAEKPKTEEAKKPMPIVFEEDFEKGEPLKKWEPMDPAQWKIADDNGNKVLSLCKKGSKYRPKVRSPHNLALIKDLWVGDFVLDLKMKSTTKDYGHRDLCVFFGHQDKTHFYYVHMALRADPHAHSVFAVDAKPRVSICTDRTKGIVWGETWHNIRLVRKVDDGLIQVFFDDMSKPIMQTKDKRFAGGRIGVGSFDDTGVFDDIKICGVKVPPVQRADKGDKAK